MAGDAVNATRGRRRRISRRLVFALAALLIVAAGVWVAFQPRVANHFSYALPGKDGLPTYIYAHGRRYQSLQVCAGDDWCQHDRLQQLIPRCYTQADLRAMHMWPLVQASTMLTVFGAPHPILSPQGESGIMQSFVMADGTGCYVTYALEGGP